MLHDVNTIYGVDIASEKYLVSLTPLVMEILPIINNVHSNNAAYLPPINHWVKLNMTSYQIMRPTRLRSTTTIYHV